MSVQPWKADNQKVWVEFLKVWGNPAGPQIFGPGQRVKVSKWAADRLESGGYAHIIEAPDTPTEAA